MLVDVKELQYKHPPKAVTPIKDRDTQPGHPLRTKKVLANIFLKNCKKLRFNTDCHQYTTKVNKME